MIHILLPAFNEEAALGAVLESIARTLADGYYKVWVVDDGSTDRTSEVAREWAGQIPLILLVHLENKGLGAAFQTGLDAILPVLSDDDILVTLDADNTQPPQLIPHLTAPVETGAAEIAIASRFVEGGREVGVPLIRRLTSRGARWIFTFLVGLPGVRDYTCGYRAFRGSLIKKAQKKWGRIVTEPGFSCAVEWLVKTAAVGGRVVEIPLILRYDRKPTVSKMPLLKTISRTVRLLLKMRRLFRSGES